MIRLTRCHRPDHVGEYFALHLAAGDFQSYPVPPTTFRMRAFWVGTALKDLHIDALDQPAASHLVRLGRGLHPVERMRLAPDVNRKRAYYDLTITAPKTISVAALLEPTHITASSVLHAHQSAVRAVCDAAGKMIESARRTAPKVEKWLGALFQHTHTREGDPHLHSHLIVPNVGRNAAGDWRAVQVHIAGVRRLRLGLIYGHELARCLRAHGLGYEIVMRQSGVPELKSLLPLCKHFARARQAILAATQEAEPPFEPARQPSPTPEIHSRSKLPLRTDRSKFRVRQRVADDIRKPKAKDADAPTRLEDEAYRWRRTLTDAEYRTLRRVLDAADFTNPRYVKLLPPLPPPISVVIRRAFESIPWGVLTTAPVLFRATIRESAGQHAMEDLRTAVKERMERRKKNLARMRATMEADSLAAAEAHYAEIEEANQKRLRSAQAARGPWTPAPASEGVARPQDATTAQQRVDAMKATETVAPTVTPKQGRSR